jgi:acyl dehydratase
MTRSDVDFDDVEVGTLVPQYTLSLTLQRLVMAAGVNRDFAPQHHDRDYARAAGAPDAFANTALVQSLFEATLRRWLGAGGRLKRLRYQMKGFCAAGSDVVCTGKITSKRIEGERGMAEVELWQESGGKQTASAAAVIELPLGKGA